MKNTFRTTPAVLKSGFALTAVALALTACGGGGDGGGSSGYTLGGTVSSLTGDGLILSDNGTTLSVASGASSFTFPGTLTGSYNVTILSQPAGETCSVTNGSGSGGSGSVTSVQVLCRAYAVYVANSVSGSIAQYTIGADGTLTAAAPATVLANGDVTSLAVSGDGMHAWSNFADDQTISDLSIDGTGKISFTGTIDAGSNGPLGSPLALAVSPNNGALYVANSGSESVSAFSINSTTGVASSLGADVMAGVNPYGLAVTSDGTRLYVTNKSDNTISGYDIAGNGSLTPLPTSAVSTTNQGTSPAGIVANPNGGTMYVTLGGSAKVVAYQVAAATGVLSVKASATTGSTPRGLAVTPGTGAFLYVVNFGSASVSEYSLAGGSLTPLSTPTVATGTHPSGITISPDGKFAYVTNTFDGTVSQYSINASSGILSPLTPATVSTGGDSPVGIVAR